MQQKWPTLLISNQHRIFVGWFVRRIKYMFNPPCACITVIANFTACPSRSFWLDICPTLDSIWLSQAQMAPGYKRQRERRSAVEISLWETSWPESVVTICMTTQNSSAEGHILHIYEFHLILCTPSIFLKHPDEIFSPSGLRCFTQSHPHTEWRKSSNKIPVHQYLIARILTFSS